MKTRDFALLLFVSSLFGAAFLFIRIATPSFGPFVLMDARVLLSAAVLALYATVIGHRFAFKRRRKEWLILGTLNAALPFPLIAYAELHITASLAAILIATMPLFTSLAAALMLKETLTPKKIGGILLGLLGVGVLSGLGPLDITPATVLAILASLASACSYALAGVYAKRVFADTPVLTVTTGSMLSAGLVLLPVALATPPAVAPSSSAILALVGLSLLSTVIAFVGFFRLIRTVGPTATSTAAYLIPLFGTLWGALFLAEPVNSGMFLALLVILASIALTTDLRLMGTGKRFLPKRSAIRLRG
ncbi:MAG: DMT family transporter [Trueperaceae bacterium]|nr:MAG: DMT family transporter [Trueperaceae bacterium]